MAAQLSSVQPHHNKRQVSSEGGEEVSRKLSRLDEDTDVQCKTWRITWIEWLQKTFEPLNYTPKKGDALEFSSIGQQFVSAHKCPATITLKRLKEWMSALPRHTYKVYLFGKNNQYTNLRVCLP